MKKEIPLQSFHSAGVMNRPQVLKVVGLLLLVCSSPSQSAPAPKVVPFDVPNSPYGSFNTIPVAINPGGSITGSYGDNFLGGQLGFVRTPDGHFVTFNPPNANTTNYYQPTLPDAINAQGVVVGYYYDVNVVPNMDRGFVRTPTGVITEFDAPGAVNGTFPLGINPQARSAVTTMMPWTTSMVFSGPSETLLLSIFPPPIPMSSCSVLLPKELTRKAKWWVFTR
jgi:hypothetical protein